MAQAVFQHPVIEDGPFVGELRARLQQRIEAAGKGRGAPLRRGPRDLADGDLDDAQRHLGKSRILRLEFRQYGQAGILALGFQLADFTQPFPVGVDIIVKRHNAPPFLY